MKWPAKINLLEPNDGQLIDLVGIVFANGPGDLGSIPSRVIPKTLRMVLDTSLLNTQHYKVYIEGKVEQSRERSSALPYTFWSPLTTVTNFTLLFIYIYLGHSIKKGKILKKRKKNSNFFFRNFFHKYKHYMIWNWNLNLVKKKKNCFEAI